MKKTLLSLITLLGAGLLHGQQISQDEACRRAQAFLSSHQEQTTTDPVKRIGSRLQLAHIATRPIDGKTLYYVFNRGQEQGFVIVGGDESAQSILGYTEHGSFQFDKLPENFRWWMSQYERQITDAIDQKASPQNQKNPVSKTAPKPTDRDDIAPMLTTQWGQDKPFNNAINAEFTSQSGATGYELVVGCVGTAMAQTMYHYRWPETGVGSVIRNPITYTIGEQEYTFTPQANFAETTYDWDHMLPVYKNKSYDEQQANAVATLCYHAGVAVDMNYDKSSSAYDAYIPGALVSYFNYDESVRFEKREYFSDQAWEDMIYAELAAGRVVIYGGQSMENGGGGHEFVCDGYRTSDGLFSINWGWESYCDGYFALSGAYALQPGGSGTGGSGEGASYKYLQEVITHILPNAGGKETPNVMQISADPGAYYYVDGRKYTSSVPYTYDAAEGKKTAIFHTSLWNHSRTLSEFTVGIKAHDLSTGLSYYWDCNDLTLNPKYYQTDYSISFDLSAITFNGSYELQPVVRRTDSENDADWFPVGMLQQNPLPIVVVHGAQETEARDVQFTIAATEVEVARTLEIHHSAGYTGSITYTIQDPTICSVSSEGIIMGESVGSTTILCHASAMYINGNKLFNETYYSLPITIVPTIKQDPIVTIADTALVVGGKGKITVENYDGTITYSSSNTAVVKVDNQGNLSGIGAGTAEITVSGPATRLYNDFSVVFTVTVSPFAASFYDVPYFNNDNNTWSQDMVLHLPIQNSGIRTETLLCYAKIQFVSGNSTLNLTYSFTIQDCPSGHKSIFAFDLSGLIASLSIYGMTMSYDTPQTINFYKDAACSIPFETPSIDFTFREDLNVTCTVPSTGYSTLILPFYADIPTKNASNLAVECHAYTCAGMSFTGVLVFEEATTLDRNVPYLITTDREATFKWKGPKAVDADQPTFAKGFLTGVVGSCSYQAGDYMLQTEEGKTFFQHLAATDANVGKPVTPFTAYIPQNDNFDHEIIWLNEADGLNSVNSDINQPGIYGLDGTQHTKLLKGLNILVLPDGTTQKVMLR